MTYGFKDTPIMPRAVGDGLIATALDGVVYTENDIYLGEGASPTINLENVEVENEEMWAAIKQDDAAAEEPKE